MSDNYFNNVVSLLNFGDMPDGDVITDAISGRSWTVTNAGVGNLINSGVLTLINDGSYINQDDEEEAIRKEFNGTYSQNWTIEGRIVVKKVATNPWLGWRGATQAEGMILRQPSTSTDELSMSFGDATLDGWEAEYETTGLGLTNTTEIEFAITRTGDTFLLHLDGVYIGKDTSSKSNLICKFGTGGLLIGRFDTSSGTDAQFDMKRFRMTKRVSRYQEGVNYPVEDVLSGYPTEGVPELKIKGTNGWTNIILGDSASASWFNSVSAEPIFNNISTTDASWTTFYTESLAADDGFEGEVVVTARRTDDEGCFTYKGNWYTFLGLTAVTAEVDLDPVSLGGDALDVQLIASGTDAVFQVKGIAAQDYDISTKIYKRIIE